MRTSGFIRAGAFALIVAAAGCGGKQDEATDRRDDTAEAPPQRAAPAQRKPAAAPKAPAPASVPETAADVDPQEALRFDMTQDGEAQTAETFEAWMDEQGVRVAEGAKAGTDKATAGAKTAAAAGQRKTADTGND